MKKKIVLLIIIILIVLIVGILLFIKNKKIEKNNEITSSSFRIINEEYKKYIDEFKIDSKEKMKIIKESSRFIMDAGWHNEYLFDFSEKKVILIESSTNYMPDNPETNYSKYEYELDDEKIEKIKERVKKLKQLNVENTNGFCSSIYKVITNEFEIEISDNSILKDLVQDILHII